MSWRPKEWDRKKEDLKRLYPSYPISAVIEMTADAMIEELKKEGVRIGAGNYSGERGLLLDAVLHVKEGKGVCWLVAIPDEETVSV